MRGLPRRSLVPQAGHQRPGTPGAACKIISPKMVLPSSMQREGAVRGSLTSGSSRREALPGPGAPCSPTLRGRSSGSSPGRGPIARIP
ncbi:hypothetical protein NDU88_007260 [Pleurodeles waltl]|uniref:Uncharacterized protein n=1 Tax=Pleurodeles waltl TaxID=8319 RepID=A0AAV7LRI7_PLEWA|nr:hypothetical protein NDU88_007260 [Pleurodeles waltl]